MKLSVLTVAAALAAIAQSAVAAGPWATARNDRAVMLYFHKTFGAAARGPAPLEIGLRWQQPALHASAAPTELIGLRFSSLGHKALSAGGSLVMRLDSMKDEDGDGKPDSSFDWDSWTKRTYIVVGILAVAGGLCLAKEVICEENRRRQYSPEPTPNVPAT